ncbi:MAG: choice-of-anchor T family protein [Candidatus Thalassarchaeaceae archaeon]|jgi:hypothetical protein|nr:choice-of-anchor T family protein [Candidatus Thalassarchaeaceae archaeon]
MRIAVVLFSLLFFTTIVQFSPPAEGQFNPDVNVTCEQPSPMHVYPEATRITTAYCTAENPTVYLEDVDIQVTASGLAYSAPDSITVPAGDSVTFEVLFRGDIAMPEGARQATISATVTTANGVPCLTCESRSVSVLVIIAQYSSFRVETDTPIVEMETNQNYTLEFKIYNDGNARDKFLISTDSGYLAMSDWGIYLPITSIEIDSMAPPERIHVIVESPSNLNGEIAHFNFQLTVTSDFSIHSEGTINQQFSVSGIKVHPAEEAGSVSNILPAANLPVTLLVILAVAIRFGKKE